MPLDKSGKFHLGLQRAHAADRAATKPAPMKPADKPAANDTAEPADADPVRSHLESMHARDGGKHMQISRDEMGGYKSHHVGEDGEVEGPHDHANIEELKRTMNHFFDEEAGEVGDHSHEWSMANGEEKDIY